MPPRCRWAGHDWPLSVTFRPYRPPYMTPSYKLMPVDAEVVKMEAYALQRCMEPGCGAFHVLDYDHKEVPFGDPRYERALGLYR